MNNQYNNYNNGYNNYNNNYNGYNYNNWNQMPNPMMQPNNNNYNNDDDSNKGGGIISFLVALILLAALVVFLLHLLGIINVKELYNKYILKETETEEVTEQETPPQQEETSDEILEETKKELDNICSLTDENGNYNKEVSNNIICNSNSCFIQKGEDIYAKNCTTNQYFKSTEEELTTILKQTTILETLCNSLDANGNYTNQDENKEYEYSCTNYVCQVKIDDKEFTKTCQKN